MNRLEQRNKVFGDDADTERVSLLQMCELVHMYCNGSLHCDAALVNIASEYIEVALATWDSDGETEYDILIKQLCNQVLNEKRILP